MTIGAGPASGEHAPSVSAQNIAVPAFTPLRDGGFILTGGWKQLSWTGVAALAFNTEAVDAFSALGSTQGVVLDYAVQATAGTTGSIELSRVPRLPAVE